VILQNILLSSAKYIQIAADNFGTHISIMALATRSLYELNVRARSILIFPTEIEKWQSEAIMDNIQIFEGIMALEASGDVSVERGVLQAEVDVLNTMRIKYSLPDIKKMTDTRTLAASVGLKNEHQGLFKLFSKLVHPSSYLTNCYEDAASERTRLTLQVHSQLYALDTLNRICEAQSVPEEIRSFVAGI